MATIIVTTGADPVVNGTNFNTALNSCTFGDSIVLQAGAIYQGGSPVDQAFLIKAKGAGTGTDADYITIQTSNLANISASGIRINPAIHESQMPKLIADSTTFGTPVFKFEQNAHHYKFIGLNITTIGVGYSPNLITIKPDGTTTIAQLNGVHHINFDRCFVHPAEISGSNLLPTTTERTSGRGFSADGAEITIQNSYIGGFTGYYPATLTLIDSYGIYVERGPGPLHIINNYIEAMFNNIFTGGADNFTDNTGIISSPTTTSCTLTNVTNLHIGDLIALGTGGGWQTAQVSGIAGLNITYTILQGNLSPAITAPTSGGTARWNGANIRNMEVRRNTLNKPSIWNSYAQPKAWIEIKDCIDCVVDGNVMQSGIGTQLALTSRNQEASMPWATILNFTYTNNTHIQYGRGITGHLADNDLVSIPGGNWTFNNNLWIQPDNAGSNFMMLLGSGVLGGSNITMRHNTMLQIDHILAMTSGEISGDFIFKDNIVHSGQYGMQCYDANCMPGRQMTNNILFGPVSSGWPWCTSMGGEVYPSGNTCVTDATAIGFVDLAANNLRLAASSPYKNTASDGTDPGVNYDALLAAQGDSGGPGPRHVVLCIS